MRASKHVAERGSLTGYRPAQTGRGRRRLVIHMRDVPEWSLPLTRVLRWAFGILAIAAVVALFL